MILITVAPVGHRGSWSASIDDRVSARQFAGPSWLLLRLSSRKAMPRRPRSPCSTKARPL